MNRGQHGVKEDYRELTPVEDGVILALWRQKVDTFDIAKQLGRPEWQIANRLQQVREMAR